MSIPARKEENKAVVRRFIHELFEKGNVEGIEDYVSGGFIPPVGER